MSLRSTATTLLLCTLMACAGSTPQVVTQPSVDPPPPAPERTVRAIERETPAPQDPGEPPPGARQLAEGYWLGGLLLPEHVPWLVNHGIRVVLSAVNPPEKTLVLLQLAGIEQVRVPMGGSFDHAGDILATVDSNAPETLYVHCRHGADRTGTIAAFLLVVRHGWSIADALYSVIYADSEDVEGLADVLERRGIDDVRYADDPRVGFYSLAAVGEVGGLKARNRRYERLIDSAIEAMQEALQAPPEERTALAPVD